MREKKNGKTAKIMNLRISETQIFQNSSQGRQKALKHGRDSPSHAEFKKKRLLTLFQHEQIKQGSERGRTKATKWVSTIELNEKNPAQTEETADPILNSL